MKKLFFILFMPVMAFLPSCSSVSNLNPSDLVAPGLGIIGSTIGAYATKDESTGTQMAATAGGGLAGILAGWFIKKGVEDEKQKEFRTGYELGQSNASKSLYWNIQKLHNGAHDSKEKVVYYNIPASYPNDGVARVPGSVVMPVVEPK